MPPRFTFHLETAQFAIDLNGVFFHLVYKLFFPLIQYLFVFPTCKYKIERAQ